MLEWAKEFRLDLRTCDVSGVDFQNADFSAAMFHDCRIEDSTFAFSKLWGTQFDRSILNFSDFYNAQLRGTKFNYTIQNRSKKIFSDILSSAKIDSVFIIAADISSIQHLPSLKIMHKTFGSNDTILNSRISFNSTELEDLRFELRDAQNNNNKDLTKTLELKLKTLVFAEWSPYDSNDAMTFRYQNDFLKTHQLKSWPYQ